MPATLEPPPAPVTEPVVPAPQVGSAVPSSKGVINVVPPPVTPTPPPPAGSPKDKMFSELRKKAKPTEEPAAADPAKPPVAAPKSDEGAPVAGASDDKGDPSEAATDKLAAATPTTPEEKKKMSPWKLVDEWKRRATEAETKYVEATKGQPSEEQRKQIEELIKGIHQRNTELEEEIKFVNFTKSREFQEKYQAPYDKAWTASMKDLGGVEVLDANGNQRQFTPADLLEVVNTPAALAGKKAKEMTGDEDVGNFIALRAEKIRDLFQQQQNAIEEAKKNGTTREQQRAQQFQQFRETITKQVSESWKAANEAAVKDEKYGKYFTPADGDEEGNEKLAKGFELVDKAFGENPYAPNLKPEERQAIAKRHAAVRNRAAAFGRLTYQNEKKDARIAELETKLKQFEGSTPPAGGGSAPATIAQPANAKESMLGALRKLAK